MLRKIVLWGFFLAIIAAIVYGYLHYAVVALYEPDTPKITYMVLLKKPSRGFDFFYNHIDKKTMENKIRGMRQRNQTIPWHMDYNYLMANEIYIHTFDNRNIGN